MGMLGEISVNYWKTINNLSEVFELHSSQRNGKFYRVLRHRADEGSWVIVLLNIVFGQ